MDRMEHAVVCGRRVWGGGDVGSGTDMCGRGFFAESGVGRSICGLRKSSICGEWGG